MKRPIIGITMGDPSSIGAEITVKALRKPEIYQRCRPIVVGDAFVLEQAEKYISVSDIRINPVQSVKEALFEYGTIDVLDMGLIDHRNYCVAELTRQSGDAAFQYVKKVIELAMNREIDATVTNAINKEAINLAGHHYSGHTEIYAEFTGTKRYSMMLAYHSLRVVHVSTHVSLREACDRVKKDRVLEVIWLAHRACLDLGISDPKIGVAGLNPHCGENGLFGREELDEIMPAVAEAKREGLRVDGPIPADSIFSKAKGGWYDIVVAMYHDQGHIPLKLEGFVYNQKKRRWDAVEGVNITLGLPIVRASVDHGTAFDQAGKGTASELSLVNAIDYGIRFSCSGNKRMEAIQ